MPLTIYYIEIAVVLRSMLLICLVQAASRRGAMHGVLFFPQKSRWSSYSDLPLFTSYLSQTIHGTGISMVHLCNVPILMTHPCSVTYVTSIWVFVSHIRKVAERSMQLAA